MPTDRELEAEREKDELARLFAAGFQVGTVTIGSTVKSVKELR
jgi:hypothetical protein